MDDKSVVIVGGGLVGALNAIFFAKRFWKVDVFESREDIRVIKYAPGKSINLALSTRGRLALRAVGCEEFVLKQGIPMYGRYIHEKDGKGFNIQPYGMKNEHIFSISRRTLNEYLLTEAEKYDNVRIHFQHKLLFCKSVTGEATFENLSDGKRVIVQGDLICGCDGAFSAVRRSFINRPRFNYSQEYIDHAYMELCINPNEKHEFQMKPNFFHLWPRGTFCLIGLANTDRTFTVTLLAPRIFFKEMSSEDKIEKFFQENFPDALQLIGRQKVFEIFRNKEPNVLLSVKCKPHSFDDRVVLMGDAAHAMVPFYGQGMNCGFEDCLVLHEILGKCKEDIVKSLRDYSSVRCPDAHAICDLAMYNYSELSDLVNHFGFRFRKFVDFMLNKLFPKKWIPLYTMVTFSRIRYHKITQIRTRQDNFLTLVQRCTTLISLVMYLWFVIRVKRTFWGH